MLTRRALGGGWRATAWLALALLSACPVPALAHAGLIASDPAEQAVLATAPTSLTLSFDEPVEPLALRLVDAQGRSTELTAIAQWGSQLILTPPAPLGHGAHVLNWRVASSDGHPVGGSLLFWIGSRDGAPPQQPGTNPAVGSAIWAVRLVVDLALLVGIGGAFFLAWFSSSSPQRGPAAGAKAAIIAGIIAIGVSVALQGLDVLGLPLSGTFDPAVWSAGTRGSFGTAAAIAATALLAGLAALQTRGAGARVWSLAALFGVGAALAAAGHTATATPHALAVAAMMLHGTGLAIWVGALLPLAVGLRGGDTGSLLRFSRAIPFAVAALLGSGLLLAALQLGAIEALWRTAYGRVLAAKLALVLALLALALWNRLGLTPRLAQASAHRAMRRSIAAEIVLVIAILGVVGLWRFTPPPRSASAGNDSVAVHLHNDTLMASATLSPARPGSIAVTISLLQSSQPSLPSAMTVVLSNPDLGIDMTPVEAVRGADGAWRATLTAPVAGQWKLGLGILVSDFERTWLETAVLIR